METANKKFRYSIRKFKVGVGSVLLATCLLGAGVSTPIAFAMADPSPATEDTEVKKTPFQHLKELVEELKMDLEELKEYPEYDRSQYPLQKELWDSNLSFGKGQMDLVSSLQENASNIPKIAEDLADFRNHITLERLTRQVAQYRTKYPDNQEIENEYKVHLEQRYDANYASQIGGNLKNYTQEAEQALEKIKEIAKEIESKRTLVQKLKELIQKIEMDLEELEKFPKYDVSDYPMQSSLWSQLLGIGKSDMEHALTLKDDSPKILEFSDKLADFKNYITWERLTREVNQYRKKHPNNEEIEEEYKRHLEQTEDSTYATQEGSVLKISTNNAVQVLEKIKEIVKKLESKEEPAPAPKAEEDAPKTEEKAPETKEETPKTDTEAPKDEKEVPGPTPIPDTPKEEEGPKPMEPEADKPTPPASDAEPTPTPKEEEIPAPMPEAPAPKDDASKAEEETPKVEEETQAPKTEEKAPESKEDTPVPTPEAEAPKAEEEIPTPMPEAPAPKEEDTPAPKVEEETQEPKTEEKAPETKEETPTPAPDAAPAPKAEDEVPVPTPEAEAPKTEEDAPTPAPAPKTEEDTPTPAPDAAPAPKAEEEVPAPMPEAPAPKEEEVPVPTPEAEAPKAEEEIPTPMPEAPAPKEEDTPAPKVEEETQEPKTEEKTPETKEDTPVLTPDAAPAPTPKEEAPKTEEDAPTPAPAPKTEEDTPTPAPETPKVEEETEAPAPKAEEDTPTPAPETPMDQPKMEEPKTDKVESDKQMPEAKQPEMEQPKAEDMPKEENPKAEQPKAEDSAPKTAVPEVAPKTAEKPKLDFTTKERKVEEALPIKEEIRYDASLALGKSYLLQEGKAGKKVSVYQDVIVDGKVVATNLLSETVVEGQNRILVKGSLEMKKEEVKTTPSVQSNPTMSQKGAPSANKATLPATGEQRNNLTLVGLGLAGISLAVVATAINKKSKDQI
ncbi:G5 domain-containing protein [Streptococcus suis]|nr:GAG-binding domain-containing protein [Streptococcus suis]MBY4967136.1 G5 domain-containing protein [Streptococcus suis]